MTYLEYVSRYIGYDHEMFRPLYALGKIVGHVARNQDQTLARIAAKEVVRSEDGWRLVGGSQELLDAAIEGVSQRLATEKIIPALRGERYHVFDLCSGMALATADRSAATFFGFRTQGVHLNVYLKLPNGAFRMWLARRALTHRYFPGQYDNLVAGGAPAYYSFEETLRREAAEEAGITSSMLASADRAGELSYCFSTEEGLVDSIIQVYDLEVDEEFCPRNSDGLVEEFRLTSLSEAERLILEGDSFKFNCGLVTLDFLVRYGASEASESRASIELLRSRVRRSL
jgi:isopentenyldiphosphate isomerase